MKRVVVGLSGGVDSSVAACLLKEQGYKVIGLFMKNWHDDSVTISDECPWLEDSHDALNVAQKLGIPFQTIDLSVEYKARIVDYMFAEYQAGKDGNKDQSYFLCQLTQEQLSYALFPIGELTKPEVRKIAKELDLVTAEKKDSQGLCFVGKVRLPVFLQQKLQPKEGKIIEIPADSPVYQQKVPAGGIAIDKKTYLQAISSPYIYQPSDGIEVGRHQGAHFFTIGQRKGLNVGGKPEPLFVIATDVEQNVIYTGMGDKHPGLNRGGLFISMQDIHWIREDLCLKTGESRQLMVRIRYRQELQKATLYQEAEGMYICFEQLQRGIAPGQFAAWYEGDELLGSGVITA